MTVVKYNIPIITEGGTPNANNLSDEMQKIQNLSVKLSRSNTGQIIYTSLSSGISYNTANYASDSTIYNKGETGLYNLLVKELDEYIIQAKDINSYGAGVITPTNWNLVGGDYKYEKYISITDVTSEHIVNINIDNADMKTALKSLILCATNNSYNGGIIDYCNYPPQSNINIYIYCVKIERRYYG